jgi:hypothetical protein
MPRLRVQGRGGALPPTAFLDRWIVGQGGFRNAAGCRAYTLRVVEKTRSSDYRTPASTRRARMNDAVSLSGSTW